MKARILKRNNLVLMISLTSGQVQSDVLASTMRLKFCSCFANSLKNVEMLHILKQFLLILIAKWKCNIS